MPDGPGACPASNPSSMGLMLVYPGFGRANSQIIQEDLNPGLDSRPF